nr:hypothetical protein [Tanacetum cinerariifolium]
MILENVNNNVGKLLERPNDENNTKEINTVGPSINTASLNINTASPTVNTVRLSDNYFGANNDMRSLDGVELDISNLSTTYPISTTPNTRINKDYSLDNVIGDIQSGVQTRRMTVTTDKQGFISAIYGEKTHVDLHICLFACFLSQEESKRITNALKDPTWVEAMQKELLQFHLQKGRTQEEGIDYDKVFAPVARIKAIRLFFVYASFMRFLVYQMDVKSAFLHGRIEEEVYVCQPPGYEDPDYLDKELCYEFEVLMHDKFQMSLMGELTFFLGLQVKQKSDRIFISQDKYVDEFLRKFKYEDVKPASTPMDKEKALLKDSNGDDVNAHLYSDYAGASLDRKSTSGGCQFLGSRLISWQCKKQTVVATSTTEAEYVAAASCYGQ